VRGFYLKAISKTGFRRGCKGFLIQAKRFLQVILSQHASEKQRTMDGKDEHIARRYF
jgi:hypothetical protein